MDKDNAKYIGFMILSMAGFAIEDAIIKELSNLMPISQVLISIGTVGLLVFLVLAFVNNVSLFSSHIKTLAFAYRMLCELISSICFVITIVFVSLSVSSAVLQVTPILVAIGGSIFFKQNVLLYQWIFIFVGLLGVLLVIQPTSESFSLLSLLALVGSFFLAFRDLVTRSISNSIPVITIAFWGFFSLTVGGFICIPFFGSLHPYSFDSLSLVILSALFGPLAYLSLVAATRGGDVAMISPYRYTRLPFALVIGFFLFDENPNKWMLLGCFLIVFSGIFVLFFSSSKRSGKNI